MLVSRRSLIVGAGALTAAPLFDLSFHCDPKLEPLQPALTGHAFVGSNPFAVRSSQMPFSRRPGAVLLLPQVATTNPFVLTSGNKGGGVGLVTMVYKK